MSKLRRYVEKEREWTIHKEDQAEQEDSVIAQPEGSEASFSKSAAIWTTKDRHPTCCSNHFIESRQQRMETPSAQDLMIRRLSLYFEKYPPRTFHGREKEGTAELGNDGAHHEDDDDDVSSITDLSNISVTELSSGISEGEAKHEQRSNKTERQDKTLAESYRAPPPMEFVPNNRINDAFEHREVVSSEETSDFEDTRSEYVSPAVGAPDATSTPSSEISKTERSSSRLRHAQASSKSNRTNDAELMQQGDRPSPQMRTSVRGNIQQEPKTVPRLLRGRPPSPGIQGSRTVPPRRSIGSTGAPSGQKSNSISFSFSSGSETSPQCKNSADFSEASTSHEISVHSNSRRSVSIRTIHQDSCYSTKSQPSASGRSRSQIIEECVRRLSRQPSVSFDSCSQGRGDEASIKTLYTSSVTQRSRQSRHGSFSSKDSSFTIPTISATFDSTVKPRNSRRSAKEMSSPNRSRTPRSMSCNRRNTSSLQDISSFSSDSAIRNSRFLETTKSNSRWSEASTTFNSITSEDHSKSRNSSSSTFYTARSTVSSRQRSRSLSSGSRSKSSSDKGGPVGQKFWIADVEAVKEAMLVRSDRRLALVLSKHDCNAELLQAFNRQRGYPHSIVYFQAPSKDQLKWLARDIDRIYPKWNVSSQLRSVR